MYLWKEEQSMATKKETYKRLGDYIELVNIRNSDLKDIPLMGLSINKVFIPSIANTIGTNMANYKVIKRNQFAYGPVTSRNGDKITIALFKDYDEALISQAYLPFEIVDADQLLPDYLMMWFSRPEFDRYARFNSHGSARETFDWSEMCDVELPIPPIEEQEKIVAEYQAIENKIKVNEQICEKLEATAQAIYKEWFVEFNFPDENGKPYKDNGGKMVWNEELEKEVPEGWEAKLISEVCEITSSKRIFQNEYRTHGVPFYRGKEITQKKNNIMISEPIFISVNRYNEIVNSYGKINVGDILMTAVGTIGSTYMVQSNDRFYFKDGNVIWFKDFIKNGLNYYIYDFMQSSLFFDFIKEITIGSTQNAITITTFGNYLLVLPNKKILEKYADISKAIWKTIEAKNKEIIKLTELKSLLLTRMVK